MILKYKLVLNAKNNLSVPDYITDGGYFSSNGNNDEWLIGLSNAETAPEGTFEMSYADFITYVKSLTLNKLNEENLFSIEMTEQEKEDLAKNWMIERNITE
jgi:hypothetical protein